MTPPGQPALLLHLRWTLPLSWVLLHHATMRTTVDVRASWDQGYATLYQYGFPLAFTHWGLVSSAEYAYFLAPLLLDWAVYLLGSALVVHGLRRFLCSRHRLLPWLLAPLWVWALGTTGLVTVDMGLGGVTWTTRHPVLDVRDPAFSWGWRGRGLDGYGPRN
ncbi:hypothetical protein [Deinococcus multiflagellatus]|uniref:Acyltransferase 3 domain-containing protein n=1 Tax=Deinococcus multiflagellatus TaxID=1656887 RepID=A0ABW1ZJD6_9DEIO|nr:hypothetical protein [Deinococcus multiflagellatus]MBZ9712404.1 hypothetical protein [Deinococcus multiflagellatus]